MNSIFEAAYACLRAATPDDLRDAAVVVLATGAVWERSGFSAYRPERDGIPGADQANVVDIGTALVRVAADPRALGRHVVILDETQDALPAGLAELLAQAGAAVEILTPHLFFGDALARSYDLGFVMKRLKALGVAVSPQHFVERIAGDVVHAYGIWDAAPRPIAGVDTVVLSLSRRPDDALYRALRDARPGIRRIGDALAPRALEAVIHDGEKTGREI